MSRALDDLVTDYLAVRFANAEGLTVEQVKRVNALEANADEGEPFTVKRVGDELHVEHVWDGFTYIAHVGPDGIARYHR